MNNPVFFSFVLGICFIAIVAMLDWFTKSDFWSAFDAFATLLTLYLVWDTYKTNQTQLDTIEIKVQFASSKPIKVNSVKRKNFSRSELKGMLRDLHKDRSNAYEIAYLAKQEFLEKVFAIQEGNGKEFIVHLDKNDYFVFEGERI